MASFSDRLKELRNEKKLTQKSLGEAIDLSWRSIQDYERGKQQPTSGVLSGMSDYFNVSTDYLLGRTDDPKRY